MVVKVYGPDYACPKRVIVCLIEKDIEFETVHVDGFKGEHKEAEYLKLQVIFLCFYLPNACWSQILVSSVFFIQSTSRLGLLIELK
jgi:hypothetical protein